MSDIPVYVQGFKRFSLIRPKFQSSREVLQYLFLVFFLFYMERIFQYKTSYMSPMQCLINNFEICETVSNKDTPLLLMIDNSLKMGLKGVI